MQRVETLGVAEGAATVMQSARYVTIDDAAIERFCQRPPSVPAWNDQMHLSPRGRSDGDTVNYVLVLDALNFCFWAEPGESRWTVRWGGSDYQGYWALTAALRRAVEEGVPVLRADYLAGMSLANVERILAGEGRIPLLEARQAHLREVGEWLLHRYEGRFTNLIADADKDALNLVRRVVDELPCFRDEARYPVNGKDTLVPFYKRAQILAVDLYGTFGGQSWGQLSRLEGLTAFADYKVPQVLRRLEILRYHQDLASVVDHMEPIPAGDVREVEIRAATIEAVERIRRVTGLRSFEVDWHLWGAGQTADAHDRPYHRTRTVFY